MAWVDINDGLPEYNKLILFRMLYQQCYGGVFSEDPIIVSGYLEKDEEGIQWIVGHKQVMWDYDFNLGFSNDDITHWAYILPPQGE